MPSIACQLSVALTPRDLSLGRGRADPFLSLRGSRTRAVLQLLVDRGLWSGLGAGGKNLRHLPPPPVLHDRGVQPSAHASCPMAYAKQVSRKGGVGEPSQAFSLAVLG